MVTATQSAYETELAGHPGRGVGDKVSAVLGVEKRSAAACQFERALRQKIVGQEESAAEILFGDIRAVIKVDCAEFRHSYENRKIDWFFSGVYGHRETHPLMHAGRTGPEPQRQLKLSFLLFGEIENSSDALWQLLLGMLDKATLTLGDNQRVDLSQTRLEVKRMSTSRPRGSSESVQARLVNAIHMSGGRP